MVVESPSEEGTADQQEEALPPAGTSSNGGGGPLVQLLSTFTSGDSAFGNVRFVLMGILAVGFLTTAGFIAATWRNRGIGPRRR